MGQKLGVYLEKNYLCSVPFQYFVSVPWMFVLLIFISHLIKLCRPWSWLITAWKVSVFRVFLVRIFLHSDLKISEYGHFLRSESSSLNKTKRNIFFNGLPYLSPYSTISYSNSTISSKGDNPEQKLKNATETIFDMVKHCICMWNVAI